MPTLLERYRAGDCEQVWAELLAHGAAIRTEPLLSAALGVAHETMTRVRANIEVLVPRLTASGYRFNTQLAPQPWTPPGPETREHLTTLEELVGPIPLALRVWYEIVGSVDLMGSHPAWTEIVRLNIYPDPLVVDSVAWVHKECVARMTDDYWLESEESAQNYLQIAPDDYHKEDVSGGSPYAIGVPDPAIDAFVLNEWHHTTFVNYLRLCFHWGGFPGFARYAEHPSDMLAYLADGLLAF